MKRLAHWDIGQRLPLKTRLAAQVVFGLLCAFAMVAVRSLLNTLFPTAGPFALVYPTVLLATLYGHWKAGMVAYAATFLWAWYFVLPTPHSFTFEVPTDPARVAINAAAALVIVVFAEAFRRAVVSANEAAEAEIARRTMLLQELEHRTKNNFALVASLLSLQSRRETSPEASAALEQATARVHSFARAYANLAEAQGEGAAVAMPDYLREVVDRVGRAAFHDGVSIGMTCDVENLPRETAVAIGLFTNEALTNCAKYAFPNEKPGSVEVALKTRPGGWVLHVVDDGAGPGAQPSGESSGLGSQLFRAFAEQADAEHEIVFHEGGCEVYLRSR